MPEAHSPVVFSGPLSALSAGRNTPFQAGAQISFEKSGGWHIDYGRYRFENHTLSVSAQASPEPEPAPRESGFAAGDVPWFSILAVFLLVVFRNVYFGPFQKYFLSLMSNFEIDFHLQRIGVGPVIFALVIIFLSFSGFVLEGDAPGSGRFGEKGLGISFSILGVPLLLSTLAMVFLGFTIRLFPIVFSDIKVFFLLALLLLVWNFGRFGSTVEGWLPLPKFVLVISVLFYSARSIIFFQVFRKAYRFHIPISLFYICILNLGTFLVLTKAVRSYFF